MSLKRNELIPFSQKQRRSDNIIVFHDGYEVSVLSILVSCLLCVCFSSIPHHQLRFSFAFRSRKGCSHNNNRGRDTEEACSSAGSNLLPNQE